MKKLKLLLGSLPLLLLISNCSTFRTSDFEVMVRLPATQNCFGVKVMSSKETEYGHEECDKMISRGIILTSENWKMLKKDILTNCQYAQCKQISGAADGLFLSIDQALSGAPLR